MNKISLSIIIPVYNVEAYLTECLDSVYIQNLEGCEVIVINDGSTDNSRQILSEYNLRYPELRIIDQENKGLSGARNTGMSTANGEYLYFLDSDDYMIVGAVEIIKDKLFHSQNDIIGFNALVNGNKLFDYNYLPEYANSDIDFMYDFYIKYKTYPLVNVWIYVYKKDFLHKNDIRFLDGCVHEDIHFSLLCFSRTKSISIYSTSIVNYRIKREGSISTNIKLNNIIDITYICRCLDNNFGKINFHNPYYYNQLFNSYIYAIIQAVENNHNKSRKKYFTLNDMRVMKKGVLNQSEFRLWLLAIFSNKLMFKYYNNDCNNFTRRFINIVSGFIYRIAIWKCYNEKTSNIYECYSNF